MLLPAAFVVAASRTALKGAVSKLPALLAVPLAPTLSDQQDLQLEAVTEASSRGSMFPIPPRALSCIYITFAMALHFGGYEFARNGALALFTSSKTGFSHPSAYPFAMGLVTPASLGFLLAYGALLESQGPRFALRVSNLISIVVLLASAFVLRATENTFPLVTKCLVSILFVFQNCYVHLLQTQQWSFLGSIMTPEEGAKWFSLVAGISSLFCTLSALLIERLLPIVGILGLLSITGVTLAISGLLADRAYALGEKHGFDPSDAMKLKCKGKGTSLSKDGALLTRMASLFRRVPTLAALFGEVVSFQCLGTILNIFFVRQLKESSLSDADRAVFTGRFYGYVNGAAGALQFIVLPLASRFLQPKWAYLLMPMILMPVLACAAWQPPSLWIAAIAFWSLKTLDYSVRTVVNEIVYQPLDFESRYLGKEVIGVFANRIGKSGLSILLSLFAPLGMGPSQLSHWSVAVGCIWMTSSFWLRQNVVSLERASNSQGTSSHDKTS